MSLLKPKCAWCGKPITASYRMIHRNGECSVRVHAGICTVKWCEKERNDTIRPNRTERTETRQGAAP